MLNETIERSADGNSVAATDTALERTRAGRTQPKLLAQPGSGRPPAPRQELPPLVEPTETRTEPTSNAAGTLEPIPAEWAPRDAMRLYLREIGQVKLLTRQEEVALAKRIRRGDQLAREEMIKANLRLVVKIAREYEDLGLPLLDLISEGNIGLIKGVERFDPYKGAKLSTYASWWIKQSIKRALANQSRMIRLPVHVVDKVTSIFRAEAKVRNSFGRQATDEQVQRVLFEPKLVIRVQLQMMRVAGLGDSVCPVAE